MILPKKRHFRLEVFDLLRGFYIFGIIVNHLALYPNLFMFITGATKLWVSFAEGFFVISGFFVGFLYRRKVVESFTNIAKKLVRRSFVLYLWSVYLTWVFTYWGNLMPRGSIKDSLWILEWQNLAEYFFKTLTLQYNYGWADILPVYTVLVFLSIGALWLIARQKELILMITSLVLWYFFRDKSIVFAVAPLYFGGLLVGFKYTKLRYFFSRLSAVKTFKLCTTIYGLFILSLALNLFMILGFEKIVSYFANSDFWIAKSRVLNWYFDKQTVGLGRLLLSPVWILSGFLIFKHFKDLIKRYLGWILGTFGKHSLYAYIIHSFVIFPAPFFISFFDLDGVLVNTLISLALITWVYILTRLTADHFKGKFGR